MPATKIGAMRIDIGADSAQFDKAMSDVQRSLSKVGAKFEAIGAKTADVGKKLSVGLTLPIVAIGAAAIQGAQAQAAAMAQVESAIKSMGNAAKLTGNDLSAFADKLEMNSLFDADEILKKSTANLLTFGNVAGETFKRAQQAAVDLATRMEGDLQGATLMVGKALNDPVKGLTALSRAGIQFTEQQKEQIKAMQASGNMAGAQAIMLAELEKQFGGAGAAAAKADPMRQVMVKLGQAGDIIGEKLLPILPVITDSIVKALDAFTSLSPEMQAIVIIGGGVAAALGPVISTFGMLAMGVGQTIPLLAKLPNLFKEGSLLMKAWPVLLNGIGVAFRFMLGPVGLAITAAGALYLAWKNWDKIQPIIASLYNGVKNWLGDKLGKILDWVGGKVRALVEPFKYLWDKVVGHSWVPDLVDGIQAEFARLDAVMVKPVTDATSKAEQAFRSTQENIAGIMAELFPATKAYREELEKLAALEADTSLNPDARAAALAVQRQRVAEAASVMTAENFPTLARPASTIPGEIQPLPGLPTPIDNLTRMQELGTSLTETFGRMGTKTGDAFAAITDALTRDIIPALQSTQQQAMNTGNALAQMGQGLTTIFTAIFGRKTGGILGAIANVGITAYRAFSGAGNTPGFANGGSFKVGGNPGIDRNVLSINGMPAARVGMGEIISVQPNNDNRAGGGTTVIINANDSVLTSTVRQWVAQGMEQAATQGAYRGSTGAQVALARQSNRRIP